MAMKSWDEDTNTIIYDENVFNTETQTWIELPSPQKSFKDFEDILKVSQDFDTGFVTIAIKHKSPHVAQEWTNLIVNQLNEFLEYMISARHKLPWILNLQMALTSYTEIKQVIAQLLQKNATINFNRS